MDSWIYVFSKFTPEALLFQALAVCLLVAAYTGFWVLKRRRYGTVQDAVPAGVVKSYLNALIRDAEEVRAQLFGLLQASGVATDALPTRVTTPLTGLTASAAVTSAVPSNEAMQRLAELEAKLNQQSTAMQGLVGEKSRLEQELAQAKQGASTTGGAQVGALEEKIKALEGKLSEYSVIEDDLANLKRLQQENAQLKAALQKQGVSAPDVGVGGAVAAGVAIAAPTSPAAASGATVAASPVASPAPVTATTASSSASSNVAANVASAVATAPTAAPVSVAPQATAGSDPGVNSAQSFEKLVDQVEKSLAPEAPPAAGASVSPTPAVSSTPTVATPSESVLAPAEAIVEKSDADLVAEFEKMLKP